MMVQII